MLEDPRILRLQAIRDATHNAYADHQQVLFTKCMKRGYHRIVPAQVEHRCIDCGVLVAGESRNIRHRGLKVIAAKKGA